MKKLLVAIFALLYISTSMGATVHMHYCMGKLADWDLGHQPSKTCAKCGMEKSIKKDNGCCKDEQKFVKNNTDQKTTNAAIQLMELISLALPVSFFKIAAAEITSITEENPASHAPPQPGSIAVYILYCVFRI